MGVDFFFVYYHESIQRQLQIRPIQECRCDERLKTKEQEKKEGRKSRKERKERKRKRRRARRRRKSFLEDQI
jgi:hypothetical protein